jgi:hypothetical protein
VFLLALVLSAVVLYPSPAAEQTSAAMPADEKPASQAAAKNPATDADVGVAAFVELSPEARAALDDAAALSAADLVATASAASQASPKNFPLATSLALTARSVLEVLPKPEDGGYLLSSPGADIPLYSPDAESLETCSCLVLGVYSSREGQMTVTLYLVSAGKDDAEKLGSFTGSYADLDGYKKAFSRILIPRFSNHAARIIDFAVSPQGASLEFTAGQGAAGAKGDKKDKALFVGSRLFLYDDSSYEVTISRKGYIQRTVSVPTALGDIYDSIQINLLPDPLLAASPGLDLKAASAQLNWKDAQDFADSSKQFSAALGRLVVSIPVTALALGFFYVGYEGYSRSAVSETGLLLRGGAAVLSAGFTIGFVVDTGIRLVRLISTAR